MAERAGGPTDPAATPDPATTPLTPEQVLAGPVPGPPLTGPAALDPVLSGPESAARTGSTAAGPAHRRPPDPLALLAGLAALLLGGSAVAGSTGWLPEVDTRWWLAGAAMVLGLLLVLGSQAPRRRR